ncbi:MAG: hypothetical protein OXU51_12110 [Candidatus Poribacteria bacterium]|nr:hypothetical protein [Candidatus Poribacteria bacterium]
MLSKGFFPISVCLVSMRSVVTLYVLLMCFFVVGCFHSKQVETQTKHLVVKVNPIDIVPSDKSVPDELLLEYTNELIYRALKEQSEMQTLSDEIQKQVVKLKKIREILVAAKSLRTDAKLLLEDYRRTYGYANHVE